MKLKYEPIKIQDNKVYFDFEKGFKQKIFARMYPVLIGENQYQSKGYGVLKTMSMLDTKGDYIDPYYIVRGSFAEYHAYLYLYSYYKDKLKLNNIEMETYEDVQYDAFKDNKWFGGKPDITMKSPYKIIHEVKSKDWTKFDDYKEDASEYKQGYMYCVLENTNKLVMVYVFLPPYVEQALKKWVIDKSDEEIKTFNPREFKVDGKTVSTNELKYIIKPHKVDLDAVKQELNQAVININTCVKNGYIPLDWFYGKEQVELDLLPF